MRRFLSLLLVAFMLFGFVISEASAKRFGGGRSIGVNRSTQSYASAPAKPMGQQSSMASKWMAPLAGLALGGILASLLMGNGLGTGILSWLAIGAVIFLIMRFIRNRSAMATQMHGERNNNNAYFSNAYQREAQPQAQMSSGAAYPAGFNSDSFLRDAKVQFVRLQTAYDGKNLADIREFTTPEMFAEIHLQLQERGDEPNQTEVVDLDAQLLDASDESASTGSGMPSLIASVRFSGRIRENSEQAAPFTEVWHFRKDIISSRWIVAGVQQH